MADLSEFLGNIVSSVSNARVQADIETVRIANEYAKNDLLQHFAVPRMRFNDVEIKIPVALESSRNKQPIGYESINPQTIASTTYIELLRILEVDKLPIEVSRGLRSAIGTELQILQLKLQEKPVENPLNIFISNVNARLMVDLDAISKLLGRKPQTDKVARLAIQNKLSDNLKEALKNEVKQKPILENGKFINVIIEADRLKEIKSENIFTITMKISEEGMEWHKIENNKGEILTKLMPE